MLYSYDFEVAPTNTVESPLIAEIKLTTGILRQIEVGFPTGTATVVRCCIANDAIQLVPSNQDGYLTGDGRVVVARPWYDLLKNPNTLYFVGWSVNALKTHTINVILDVKDPDEPDLILIQRDVLKLINEVISLIRHYL